MNEKKSLAQLLRSSEVYGQPEHKDDSAPWQESLLQQFEHPEPGSHQARQMPPVPHQTPLQWHHVLTMAPAGLGLFLAGWIGGQSTDLTLRIMEVSPLAWIACSLILSGALFGWWKIRFQS